MSTGTTRELLVFHVRWVNSLDHMAPIIWKLLTEHEKCRVIMFGPAQWETDYRVSYLSVWARFEYRKITIYDRLRHKILSNRHAIKGFTKFTFFRLLHKFLSKYILLNKLFLFNEPRALIYEWGGPYRLNHTDAIHNGVPTFCLPHGTYSYKNFDISNKHKNFEERAGGKPDFSDRNLFHHYVFQTVEHKVGYEGWGISSDITRVWGNARFSPEWSRINRELAPKFISPFNQTLSIKCLFFLIPAIYRVSEAEVVELVRRLISLPDIQIIFCARPDCLEGVQALVRSEIESSRSDALNVIFDYSTPPPSLVDWCDVVLNYGSSIVFEGLLQQKPVIHMPYLQENVTIFDDSGVVASASSTDDVIFKLQEFKNGKLPLPTRDAIIRFFKSQNLIIDGGVTPPSVYAREIMSHSDAK